MAHQITLPAENIGTFKPDEDYNDEVGETRLQPPGDRKASTVGRRRKKRHESKGEEGTTRRSKKKKKAADAGSEDTKDDTDGATLDELLFGSLEEQIQDDGDISEDNAPARHDFELTFETAAERKLREMDAIPGDDGSVHSAGTEKGLQNLESDDDLTLLAVNSDGEETRSAGRSTGDDEGDLQAYRFNEEVQNQQQPSNPMLFSPTHNSNRTHVRKAGRQGGG